MALKIYFCDGCNESIPLKDINENRITIDAGKIFCAQCAPKKPVARRRPIVAGRGRRPRRSSSGLGFGLDRVPHSQQIHDLQRELRTANHDLEI